MSNGYVQAPADNAGKLVDSEELTNPDGLTVERLRVSVPDGVKVSGEALSLILQEVSILNEMLAQAFGLGAELEVLRNNGVITNAD